MTIARHCLRVQNAAELVEFYTNVLGMRDFGTPAAPLLGYDADQCLLELRESAVEPIEAQRDDFYWKIGITLRDLDRAMAHLQHCGLNIPPAYQFGDIGYMTHLQDPQGFPIEFLQQGFEGSALPTPEGHAVGAQATLAHITVRVTDLETAKSHCEDDLGMRLMSVQPIHGRGFCLYFYGWSDEALPNADLEAVENREWLWARPYALLELQHLESPDAVVRKPDPRKAGFDGIAYRAGTSPDLHYVKLFDRM